MMSFTKKRPTFLRFLFTVFIGLIASGGILMMVQQFYQTALEKSTLREPFFILAGISALLIALFLLFPANKPFRLFKWLWRLVIMVVLVALVWGIGGFYIAQNDVLYFPGRREVNAEAFLEGEADVEAIKIQNAEGVTYQGYFWKTTAEQAGLILYFGGNGELAAGRITELKRIQAAQLLTGYHFMMVDYPGYGQSAGEPTEKSILDMAQLAYDYAVKREDVRADRIVLAGWSLGSGPAAKLAADNQAVGLILMSPFFNGTEMVKSHLQQEFKVTGLAQTVSSLFVRNKYPNDQHAKTSPATMKTLVLGAKQDTMIPFEQAERLAALYPNAEFVLLEGPHYAPWTEAKSHQAIAQFLLSLQRP